MHHKIHLGFDGRILTHPYSGIGCYLLNLIRRLNQLEAARISLYSDRPLLPEYRKELDDVRTVVFGEKRRRYWGRWLLAGQLKKDQVNLYHAIWSKGIPIHSPCPTILTLHDVFPLVFPDLFAGWKQRWKYRYHLFMDALWADRIITISECTRMDLIQRHPFLGKKIAVILDGVDLQECHQISSGDVERWKKQWGLQRPYLVSVLGRLVEKRKNINTLITAFQLFQRIYPETTLVIVGVGTTPSCKDAESVKILENIPRSALLALIKGAQMMVHPTLYEGFGLPILEAMACGVSVIAGEVGSVSELFEGAALLVNPRDSQELSMAMKRMMGDRALRHQYESLGMKRAEEFSWDKTVTQTLQLYQSLLSSSERS